MKLALIVEGHAEVQTLPLLVRRIAASFASQPPLQVQRPHRVPKSQLIRQPEFQRAIELAVRRVGNDGAILVVLDADDDLGCVLGPKLLNWADESSRTIRTSVVVAQREFEAWFLAAARSLRGQLGLPNDYEPPADPERVRGAKERLAAIMPNGYSETIDQPRLAAAMSLQEARTAPSFDKLVRELARICGEATSLEV